MKSSVFKTQPSSHQIHDENPNHETDVDFICIAEIGNEAEVGVIQSILDQEKIHYLVQGHHHHHQLGFIGAYIRLRLLVKNSDLEKASLLIDEYIENYNQEDFILGEEEGYIPYSESSSSRWFSQRTQQMGFCLMLSLFLGFGTASLFAKRFFFALLFAGLQISMYLPDGVQFWMDLFAFQSQADLNLFSRIVVSGGDILVAWTSLLYFNSVDHESQKSQSSS